MRKLTPVCVSVALFITATPVSAVDGNQTAGAINARYNNTETSCNDNPRYYCAGVVVRTNETTTLAKRFYDTWEAYQPTLDLPQDFLSFSFLSRDDKLSIDKNIYKFSDTGFGIVLNAAQNAEYSARCIYPTDGDTVLDSNHGCGRTKSGDPVEGDDNSTCSGFGVSTPQEFIKLSESTGLNCSFSAHSKTTFETALATQKLIVSGSNGWNEMIINASEQYWSSDDPAKNGIQAFWYSPSATANTSDIFGLAGAQKEQENYYNKTGAWLPVLKINPDHSVAPFSYSEADQKILEGNK